MKHKKVILLILGLMLSLCLFFGISYAFWLKENTQDIKNIANSGCFNLSLTEETSAININNLYPIKDEESTNLTPYTFTLKNTCNYNAYYEINLETLADTNIDLKFLKASLNNNNPKLISEFPKTSNIINNAVSSNKLLSGYLSPGKSATYSLRIWMSYDTTLDDVRNDGTDMWQGKITIKSSYISNETLDLACVNAGGDMIADGECRKYYVKLNEQIQYPDFSKILWGWNQENLIVEKNNLHYNPDKKFISSNAVIYYFGVKNANNVFYEYASSNIDFVQFHFQASYWFKENDESTYTNFSFDPTIYSNFGSVYYIPSQLDKYFTEANNAYPDISKGSLSIGVSFYIKAEDYLKLSYKQINLIDLTLMFGEGYEPDKEWCDKYLTEFIEYNKEGTLIPIKEIGTIVPTAYYETISLTK